MSNTDTHDPFAGSSGLADDIDVTFTNCRFGVDPQYTDTETGDLIPIFKVDFVTDSGDIGTLEDQFISIGKGWEVEDDGAKVVRAAGAKGGFNVNSYLQQIVARLLELNEGVVRGRYEATGLTPQEAAYWEGLRCHMVQEEYTTGGFKNVEKRTRSKLMPTAVYGWDEAEEAKPEPAKKSVAKKAAAKAKPAKKVVEDEPAEDVAGDTGEELSDYAKALAAANPEIVESIRAIAADADTDDDFISRCYGEIEGLDDDEHAQFLVDNVDDDETIWAQACA